MLMNDAFLELFRDAPGKAAAKQQSLVVRPESQDSLTPPILEELPRTCHTCSWGVPFQLPLDARDRIVYT